MHKLLILTIIFLDFLKYWCCTCISGSSQQPINAASNQCLYIVKYLQDKTLIQIHAHIVDIDNLNL